MGPFLKEKIQVFFAKSRMLFYKSINQGKRESMEAKDRTNTIQELIRTNFEFKQLYKEHDSLEQKLEKLSKVKFASIEDEKQRKELQKKKLVGRDRMEQILRQHQNQP